MLAFAMAWDTRPHRPHQQQDLTPDTCHLLNTPISGWSSSISGDIGQSLSCHAVQALDLRQDELGIFAVVRQTFHHRTEQCLRKPRRDVEGFLDRELASLFGAFDHVPALIEEVDGHRTSSHESFLMGTAGNRRKISDHKNQPNVRAERAYQLSSEGQLRTMQVVKAIPNRLCRVVLFVGLHAHDLGLLTVSHPIKYL
jgi:hypothetical protein